MVLRQVLHRLSGLQLLLSKTDTKTCGACGLWWNGVKKQIGYRSDRLKDGRVGWKFGRPCFCVLRSSKVIHPISAWKTLTIGLLAPWKLSIAIHSNRKNGPTLKPCSECWATFSCFESVPQKLDRPLIDWPQAMKSRRKWKTHKKASPQ